MLIENEDTIQNKSKNNKMKQIKGFEKTLKNIEPNEIQSFRLINSNNSLIDKKNIQKVIILI